MFKTCENCKATFKTRDSRRKSCSNDCANVLRRTSQLESPPETLGTNKLASFTISTSANLPPPEELPAPYAKRVYDMWAALTGSGDVPTRIA